MHQRLIWLDRWLGWIIGGANVIAGVIVFLLMLLVVADIVGRYVFNAPVPMTFEIGGFALVFIVFLALAYTQRHGAHIRVEVLLHRLPPKVQAGLDVVAYILGFAVYTIIAYQSLQWAWASYHVQEHVGGLVKIPKYPSQFVVPVGAILLCLQFLADLWRRLR